MSKPLKPRRGTTAGNNAFVGEAYEVTYDTDKNTLVCRDGLTAGGFPLAKEGDVSSLDSTLRAFIAEEVGDAASEASSQLSSLDSTLRALIAEEVAKKLSKSGDVLSGPLKIKGADDSTYTIFPNQAAHCLVIAALDSNGKEKNAFYLHTDVPAVVMRSYADDGTSVDMRLSGNDKKAYLANQALLTANATAYAATRTPNTIGVAFGGSSYTLPAGGSWSAFFVDTTASYCGGWVTVAGGTVLNLGANKQWRGLIVRNN